jgi:hypothetical protein
LPKKARTLDQIRAMQAKAVRFLRHVVGDPEKAEEFEKLSPEEYAERKRIEIKNPFQLAANHHRRRLTMATRQKLQDRIAELEEENQNLEEENQNLTDKIDSIVDIVSDEEEDEDEVD